MPTQSSSTLVSRLFVAASVAALSLSVSADTRYWADTNGGTAPFNAVDSWDPAPTAMSDVEADTLVLNKGVDKIAQVGTGDDVSVATLYVGWGTTNGTDMAASLDKGGRLDVTGGLLTVANDFWLGGGYSDKSNNVVNVSGGSLVAGRLLMAGCDSNGGKKSDVLTISGGATVQTTGNTTLLADYSGGLAYVNITDGGSFVSSKDMYIADEGKASLTVDGGTIDLTDRTIRVGNSGAKAIGTLYATNATVKLHTLHIGYETGSSGMVEIEDGTAFTNTWAVYLGRKGTGTLTVNGGEFFSAISVNFSESDDGIDGSVINLNGGVFKTAEVRCQKKAATINWNGGTITGVRHDYVTDGKVFKSADSERLTINVLSGGAIYESAGDGRTYSINIPLSGPGAIIKRGADPLTITAATDVRGGFKVEGGTLNVSNLARTRFIEISVDAGCTLNLNGASVEVASYKVAGQPKAAGTYSEQGGTITVLSTETLTPASATWTNADGDNDVTNPNNWIVFNAAGEELLETIVPAADLPITVIYGPNLPSFATFTDVTWVVEDDVCSEGYSRPAVLKTAAVWYDPSDTSTLTVSDGKVTAMANKGLIAADAGQQVDLDLEQRDTGKDAPALSSSGFNGRQAIYFDNASGFRSKGNFPADFPANGGRTLFVVAKGDVNSMIMLMISQGRKDKEEGRSLLLAHKSDSWAYGTGYKFGHSTDGGTSWSADKASFDDVKSNTPYVFAGLTAISGDNERAVSSSAMGADGKTIGSTKNVSMPTGEQGVRFNTYYGSFELSGYNIYKDTNGYQGEALIFTNALSDAEMDEVNAYLKAKWLDAMQVMPGFDSLVVNAQVDLGGTTRTFEKLSGSGSFVDGTVVVTGDLVVTVNVDQSVVVPTFDKLVLGPSARLVVNGARNLPTSGTINIIPFTSLEGEFSSVVGDRNTRVILRYLEDHVCARRDAGFSAVLR